MFISVTFDMGGRELRKGMININHINRIDDMSGLGSYQSIIYTTDGIHSRVVEKISELEKLINDKQKED